jgi:alpha,alpha-trehalase
VVHSWVATRRDRKHSWELFEEALKTDICDIQGGTTAEGIHLGAMSGSVDMVQRGYTGLEARGDLLRLNPAFPVELKRVNFHIRYRGHWLDLDIDAKRVRIEALQSGARAIKIQVKDQVYNVEQGRTIECELS